MIFLKPRKKLYKAFFSGPWSLNRMLSLVVTLWLETLLEIVVECWGLNFYAQHSWWRKCGGKIGMRRVVKKSNLPSSKNKGATRTKTVAQNRNRLVILKTSDIYISQSDRKLFSWPNSPTPPTRVRAEGRQGHEERRKLLQVFLKTPNTEDSPNQSDIKGVRKNHTEGMTEFLKPKEEKEERICTII